MNLQFKIDDKLCIGCGECVRDCPYSVLQLEDEHPVILLDRAEQCIGCLHCMTVCPTGALSILGKDPVNSQPLKNHLPTAKQMETLIKGRRSVRHYLQESLSESAITHLLQIAGQGPTGVNNRQLLFTVIDRMEDMERFRQHVMKRIDEKIKNNQLAKGFDFFKAIAGAWKKGDDILFRDAPHLLLVSSPADGPTPLPDSFIALSYFELMAQSMGIGTLWNGFVYLTLTNILPEMQQELGIPANHTLGYIMSFGKPDVHYHRTVQRDDIQINRIRMT